MTHRLHSTLESLKRVPILQHFGHVRAVIGLSIEVEGLSKHVSIGSSVYVHTSDHHRILGEVIGFNQSYARIMAYEHLEGIAVGNKVEFCQKIWGLFPSDDWLGHVINPFGMPLDTHHTLRQGTDFYPLKNSIPNACKRQRLGPTFDLGIKALNVFTTMQQGQRMGIFAGSGVGKSSLMAQIARFADADVIIVGLIGERGREVREFVEDHLSPQQRHKCIVVVGTSDQSALMRRQVAYTTMCLSEYFRDNNKHVICVMDSITRFALAQREIGLSCGEPPTTRGFPPSVFSEFPRIMERAGPGQKGMITAFFTVLVDGDDFNEPIADAIRGILDGHIVLDRKIAERGRFPAINVLRSLSRTIPHSQTHEQFEIMQKAKHFISIYEDMEELIRLGAYQKGQSSDVDQAIMLHPKIENFLAQNMRIKTSIDTSFNILKKLLP